MTWPNSDLLQKYGVRIRFVGLREKLPERVCEALAKMERVTAGNTK